MGMIVAMREIYDINSNHRMEFMSPGGVVIFAI